MNLFITALVGLVSAVAGGIVKGYWEKQVAEEKHRSDSNMAKQKFESDLILSALQSEETDKRIKSLKFLIETSLIKDKEVIKCIRSLIKNPKDIPQFLKSGTSTESAKEQFLAENPELKGRNFALTGFKVRHGDIVDALTPIFSELKPDLTLGNRRLGKQAGGGEGVKETLEKDGYIVTGIDTYRGDYFGASHLIQIQIYWHRLTLQGVDPTDEKKSDKLGTGKIGKDGKDIVISKVENFRAEKDSYISDYNISTVGHTDGTLYVGDIEIKQRIIPHMN